MYNPSVPPKIEIEGKYLNQKIKAGSQIMIPANVSGTPAPKVSWSLNGKSTDTFSNVSIEKMNGSSTLKVKGSEPKNAGKYSISAENDVGSESVEINVTVIGKFVFNPGSFMCIIHIVVVIAS